MKAEQLKVIAEGLGYEVRIIIEGQFKGELQIKREVSGYWNWYRPHTTNNNQMVEIMDKLLGLFLEVRFRKVDDIYWCELIHQSDESKDLDCEGATKNEAVCKAAFEYFSYQRGVEDE